jgi:putative tryptophan/tyrosine transport system substrate-binding protein
MIRRRMFLAAIGAATTAWPVAVRAQQKAIPVIGFLAGTSDETATSAVAAFRRGLSEAGYVMGRSLAIEYRWAEGHYDRLPALAADLAARKVDAIMASGTAPALAAKNATTTIPIIFVGGDPVEAGLVASLARPGANLTGISMIGRELDPKRLQLLSELVPHHGVIALLINPSQKQSHLEALVRDMQAAARANEWRLSILSARTEDEIDDAFATLARLHAAALVVTADWFFDGQREQLAALAARVAIPAVYEWREFTDVGGLMSYGPSLTDTFRQAGVYAGRVLAGAKPAALPIQQPTRLELVVNLKAAKAIGLIIPQSILARADEVIE